MFYFLRNTEAIIIDKYHLAQLAVHLSTNSRDGGSTPSPPPQIQATSQQDTTQTLSRQDTEPLNPD